MTESDQEKLSQAFSPRTSTAVVAEVVYQGVRTHDEETAGAHCFEGASGRYRTVRSCDLSPDDASKRVLGVVRNVSFEFLLAKHFEGLNFRAVNVTVNVIVIVIVCAGIVEGAVICWLADLCFMLSDALTATGN